MVNHPDADNSFTMSGRTSASASEEWQLKERKVARSRKPATERSASKSRPRMSNLGSTTTKTRRSTGGAPGSKSRTPSPQRGHSGRTNPPSSRSTTGRATSGKVHSVPWADLTLEQKRTAMRKVAKDCGIDVDLVIERKEANVCMICQEADHRFWKCPRKGQKTSSGTSTPATPATAGATAGAASTGTKRKFSGNNPSGLTPAAKTKQPPGGFTKPGQSYAKVTAGDEKLTVVIQKASPERSKEIHSLWLKAVVEAIQNRDGYPKVVSWLFGRDGDVVTLKDEDSHNFAIRFFKKNGIGWESWREFRQRTAWPRYQGFASGQAMHNIPAVALKTMLGDQLQGGWELVGLKPTPTGLLIHIKVDENAEESLRQQDKELFCCFGKVKFTLDSRVNAAKRLENRVEDLKRELDVLNDQLHTKMVDLEEATRLKEAAGDDVANAMATFTVTEATTEEPAETTTGDGQEAATPTPAQLDDTDELLQDLGDGGSGGQDPNKDPNGGNGGQEPTDDPTGGAK